MLINKIWDTFFLFDWADRNAVKQAQCLFVPKYSVRAIKCDYIFNYSILCEQWTDIVPKLTNNAKTDYILLKR